VADKLGFNSFREAAGNSIAGPDFVVMNDRVLLRVN